MKRITLAVLTIALTAVLSALATSCGTDDALEYTPSSDCFMKAAGLGKLKRIMHTLDSKGKDSTYVTPVTGSYYPLSIDQKSGRIYNADSLPKGTDAKHIVFSTITASGSVMIRSLATGKDTIFTASDSTDFTAERLVTVYSPDGLSQRPYRMSINVHREEADSFRWTRLAAGDPLVAALTRTRALFRNNGIYLFGNSADGTVLLTASPGTPLSWTRTLLNEDIDIRSVQLFKDRFFALREGEVMTSTDGHTWTATGSDLKPDLLPVAGTAFLTAIKDRHIYSSSDGHTWTEDRADTPLQLPTENTAGIRMPSPTDPKFENLLFAGLLDGNAVVWKRNIDLTPEDNEVFPWIYLPPVDNPAYTCPATDGLILLPYDDSTLLIGTDRETNAPLLRLSRDNGRSWRSDEFGMPSSLAPLTAIAATVDEANCIWLFCCGSGEIWRGRLNRLGWREETGTFLKSMKR